jgi:acetyl-CoA synthetase
MRFTSSSLLGPSPSHLSSPHYKKIYFSHISGQHHASRLTLDRITGAQLSPFSPRLPPSASSSASSSSTPPSAATPPFRLGDPIRDRAHYESLYQSSLADPDTFWGNLASSFTWKDPWTTPGVVQYNYDYTQGPVTISWFAGGTTNLCYNAVDRHVETGHGHRVAFMYEGNNPGETDDITYQQLQDEVSRVANYLKSKGVKKGDRVVCYMSMIPQLPMVMLACARIGAVHAVVFGGFSAEALASRIVDAEANVVVTCSASMRGSKRVPLKSIVDDALEIVANTSTLPKSPEHVLVYDHPYAGGKADTNVVEGRDEWWSDTIPTMSTDCEVEWVGAEDPLFLLYTSGSTGKPKGVVHATGGLMVSAATTFQYVFDHKPGEDVYWCTADCGWITGHSYVTYGPLLNGATQVIFEGVPTYPDAGRWWEIAARRGVSLFYTAPTAIRSLMSLGNEYVTKHDLSKLRVLGSVGEPINPEAWQWYHDVVGSQKCEVVDTWWQTETGAHMITPLGGGQWPLKPGSATLPFFGVEPVLVDATTGHILDKKEAEGLLCMKSPHPSMMRTLAGDHARFEATYFQAYPGLYFTGDGARRDADGYYWITGRVDDVINVSGHRMGTAEVEAALNEHPRVSESAVVGLEHPIKGQSIYAYVTLMGSGTETYPPEDGLKKELVATVRRIIGPIATPDTIHWAPGLPKTRSGKIMRRVLRKIAAREESELGDTSTLADPGVVDELLEMRGK